MVTGVDRGFYVPLSVVSAVWLLVALLGPVFVPKGPNRLLIVISTVLTAACCYLFWVGTFLAQFHPLFGPQLSNESARIIMRNWTVSVFDLTSNGYVNEDVMYTFTYICVNMYSRARVC
ncbi:ATPase H+-transporting V0 subunit e2 [Fasciolopsis buskii]|uniref:ATPase H+-transporting V0 subunit e2 n=1 Tax=Fasciolopsis buskii TaxID=27845 RepID=A0A8E0RIM4_9TREM|nr:ATPase H+-transporting V0 subunit e2 [Fasciolopsis buski]